MHEIADLYAEDRHKTSQTPLVQTARHNIKNGRTRCEQKNQSRQQKNG